MPIRVLSDPTNIFSSARTQTFEALDLESDEVVILRVVHSDEEKLVRPLKDALLALQQIHIASPHPGVMRLTDDAYFTCQIGADENASIAHCMVGQKIDGITLHAWSKEHGEIDEALAIKWLKQLISAVAALHEKGFMHRDTKPENIIVDQNQQLVLIDFDAICRMDIAARENIPAMGTDRYMASEQSEGNPRPSSDLYSAGIVISELLIGKSYSETSRKTSENVEWPDSLKISEQLKDLLARMTHPNRLNRPISAMEVLGILEGSENWVFSERWDGLIGGVKVALATFILTALAGLGAIAFSPSQQESDRLLVKGNQLILSGNTEQGISLIEQGVELNPSSVDLRNSLALAQSFLGDSTAAVENFEAVLELDPDNPFVLYNLASTYEVVDIERSIPYYTAAAQIDSPIQTSALNGLARAYLLTNRLSEAQEILSDLTEKVDVQVTQPSTKMAVFKNAAWANFQQRNLETAQVQLAKAIDADPTQADPYCLLALIQQQAGEDNYADRITCLLVPVVTDKPELRDWKSQLVLQNGQ